MCKLCVFFCKAVYADYDGSAEWAISLACSIDERQLKQQYILRMSSKDGRQIEEIADVDSIHAWYVNELVFRAL